jgi:hypothetical protein
MEGKSLEVCPIAEAKAGLQSMSHRQVAQVAEYVEQAISVGFSHIEA